MNKSSSTYLKNRNKETDCRTLDLLHETSFFQKYSFTYDSSAQFKSFLLQIQQYNDAFTPINIDNNFNFLTKLQQRESRDREI